MRGLIGEIVSRFERKGLLLVAAKLVQISDEQARELYAVHSSKPFFQELVSHVTSAPVFVMVWEGPNAVSVARNLVGATNPANRRARNYSRRFCSEYHSKRHTCIRLD